MIKTYTAVIFSLILSVSTISHASESKNWENYYQKTLTTSDPHKTLLLAQQYFQRE